jgi:hypothetical protein
MPVQIFNWFNRSYPQNFMLKKPFIGTLIFLASCFIFIIIYKPLNTHESRFFNYTLTMAAYCCALSFPLIVLVKILKKFRYFSKEHEWTIAKEIISILIILAGMGISVYFMAFLFEQPSDRWNLPTFFDSLESAFLVGMIPFLFFTILNYRYLNVIDFVQDNNPAIPSFNPEQPEQMVRIESKLKKEELSFYPDQLIYTEADGNYVVFYLIVENKIRKEIIRNSISNIEQQLLPIPFIIRTHRAFIVNVKSVRARKGNTLGYHLKLAGIESEIPVSRQNTQKFNLLLKQYR